DYQGKWLLLYFYPKDSTPGCTAEACSFRDHFEDLKGKVEVLGVSHDTEKSHAKFAEKYQLPFTLLSDPNKKIIEAYGAKGFLFTKRISYLINPHGIIVKKYDKVSPRGHAAEVLEDWEHLSRCN
ncbi:MAG: peroxiredoxin, partial [Deltaproteobacteria bacterium]|nr:peroxiredoxin [Deltaproteobacteria bacterium]